MSSERLRQRDTHRYYQAWLESSVGFDEKPVSEATRYHLDGTQLNISKDTSLTAFAQLGCLKLNVKRGIVTLISSTRQYILAEATQSTSLVAGQPDHDTEIADDAIWFGNASIPRSQGISAAALSPPNYTAHSKNGDSFTAPALVVNDITQHDDFRTRGYAGNGVRFYCGIPIVTKNGSAIGVFTLSHDQPRDGLLPNELRFLCDMATVVMRHLEAVKNEAARFRGESMVVGLGQFVQGASSVSSHKAFRRRLPSPQAKFSGTDTTNSPEHHHFRGMDITAADPSALRVVSLSEMPTHYEVVPTEHQVVKAEDADHAVKLSRDATKPGASRGSSSIRPSNSQRSGRQSTDNIFSRAANILRECCAADGVLFFDAVSTNLAKRSSPTGFRSANNGKGRKDSDQDDNSRQRESDADSHTSKTGDSEDLDSNDEGPQNCNLLGFSMDVTEQKQSDAEALRGLTVTEGVLRRFIKQYPQGKVFYFTPDGTASSSDNETILSGTTSDEGMLQMRTTQGQGISSTGGKGPKAKFADALKRLVPQAQNVIWLPLWDFSKQRWSAGLFLWTKMAEQLVLAQDDLVYLRTFANSIMVEVARQDAASADDTKTTFIANISHELRSPLHGVIGSCELLKDTKMDSYQASLVKAIDLCGKTLNDTVDHVLDYSKMNQLMKKGSHLTRSSAFKTGRAIAPATDRALMEDNFDLSILIEDAVESVWASQSAQHQWLRKKSQENEVPPAAASEQKDVQVIIRLAHQSDWWVRSQPGAIKRILTNLVQNAVKYTDQGTVTVALSVRNGSTRSHRHPSNGQESQDEHHVTISVSDTGRGMSSDFVRNHAFTPFSQESTFSDGTGLGLSIVQLIVDSLGGKIELKSKPGIGTEIKVHLRLPRSKITPGDCQTSMVHSINSEIAGKSICLVHHEKDESENSVSQRRALEAALSTTTSTWFGIGSGTSTNFEDVVADFYVYTSVPKANEIIRLLGNRSFPLQGSIIVLASKALQKLELSNSLKILEQHGVIVEVTLHPLGPQKLADVLHTCCKRMTMIKHRRASVMSFEDMETRDVSFRGAAGQHNKESNGWDDQQMKAIRRSQQPVTEPSTSTHSPSDATQAITSISEVLSTRAAAPPPTLALTSKVDPMHATKRILLVDDNEINLTILKAVVKKSRIAFEAANDGLEALEKFKQAALDDSGFEMPFTHILMDINMPVMDGIESTRLIRRFEKDQENKTKRMSLERRSARSEHGMFTLTGQHDNETLPDLPDDDCSEAASDITGSLPTSPIEQQGSVFPTLNFARTRPVLSHNQTTGVPTRATTYAAESRASRFENSRVDTHQQQTRPQRVKIIALSGVAFEQTQKDMFDAGADLFFAKPVKLKDLAILLAED